MRDKHFPEQNLSDVFSIAPSGDSGAIAFRLSPHYRAEGALTSCRVRVTMYWDFACPVCLWVRPSTFAMLFEALAGSWSSLPGAPYPGFGGRLDSLKKYCTRI